MSGLIDWPPSLDAKTLAWLTTEANTYALTHGLAYLPVNFGAIPTSAIHAPFTLLPTPFPRNLFESAVHLQHIYNVLYSRIACDCDLLDRVLGDETGIGRVDHFTGALWRGWKNLRDRKEIRQSMHLGLFRSDYLMHSEAQSEPWSLKQVEFNTISSSFGSLSTLVSGMHRYLYGSPVLSAPPPISPDSLPPNDSLNKLAAGLARGHGAYGNAGASILFIVQDGERNVFDQKLLEFELLNVHGISSVRCNLQDLSSVGRVNSKGAYEVVSDMSSHPIEISVAYFRAGYTPTDYASEKDYEARFILEGSRALKCPTIPLQLAGTKKIQEHLTHGTHLDDLLSGATLAGEKFSDADIALVRKTWMNMWSLNVDNGAALEQHQNLVLKPQREGGGNNIYRDEIPKFLESLPFSEREAWIAMDLIKVPPMSNLMIKSGSAEVVQADTVSELGIYGWSLFDQDNGILEDANAGWLLRTKGKESNEGGIAVGISVLDSPVLF